MNNFSKMRTGILAIVFLLILVALQLFFLPLGVAPNVNGSNYKNVTVWTRVNISHSLPSVLVVSIYEASNVSARNITIAAGSTKKVFCNATVRDWEGFNDVTFVNATLYHVLTSNYSSSDDNNSHYVNSSCVLNSSLSAYTGYFVCGFDVLYYANNGSWVCNVSVQNSYTPINANYTGFGFNTTVFYPVYALNVTDGIDYGSVAVEEYSLEKTANLTNLGNMPINVTVEGYGVRRGDGLAMNCSLAGNITVDNERFSLTNGTVFGSKISLTNSSVLISDLTISKQTVPSTYVFNSTYWELYIPPSPGGNCSGFVLFTAIAP